MQNTVRQPRAKVTIRHVAEDAGVSTAAVSKVLRDAYGVSENLRAKVLQSIEKLGYRPSTAARGMRGRTYVTGMLVVELGNQFLPLVADAAKGSLRAAGTQMLIGVSDAHATLESKLIDSMIDMRVDGLILVAPRIQSAMLANYAAQIPMVVIGHHEPSATTFDTVNSNDELGARLAVEGLAARGKTNIQMISLRDKVNKVEVMHARERGYRAAMQDIGQAGNCKVWRVSTEPREGSPTTPQDHCNTLEDVLDARPYPDAIFCWSDIHAVELINLAKVRGISVPEEIAIIGYDNTPTAQLPMISLSSVEQKGAEIGSMAADLLLSRIEGRSEAQHVLVTPELMERGSTIGGDD